MELYISIFVSLLITILISVYTKNKGFHIDFISISFGLILTLGSRLFIMSETQEIDKAGFYFIFLLLLAIGTLSIFTITLWLSYESKYKKSEKEKNISKDFVWACLNYASSFITAIFCLQLMFAVTINMNSLKNTSDSEGELHYFLTQIYSSSKPTSFFIIILLISAGFIVYRILNDRKFIINLK